MNRKDLQPSFSDVVAEVRSRPVIPPTIVAGIGRDEAFTDSSGRRYELVDDKVSAAEALARIASADVVAWDDCGCGGDCGFVWLDKAQIAALAAAGEPITHRRQPGHVSTWQSADGAQLVLISGKVLWGTVIAPG